MGEIPENVLALHANIMAQFENMATKKCETVTLTRESVEQTMKCLDIGLQEIASLRTERDKLRGQVREIYTKWAAWQIVRELGGGPSGRPRWADCAPHNIVDGLDKAIEATQKA